MNNFDQIATFVRVVELGSFSAVADELDISVAAVSRQVKTLETSLGVKLLWRNTRTSEVTDLGQKYYNECKDIIARLTEANQRLQAATVTPAGRLHVYSGRFFAMHFIIPYLKEFLTLYPKIEFYLDMAERPAQLFEEHIDVIFGIARPNYPQQDTIIRPIAKARCIIAASPDYIAQFGAPNTPLEMKNHRYIAHAGRENSHIIPWKNHSPTPLIPYLKVNDSIAMIECALSGLGIIKTFDYHIKAELEAGTLVEVLKNEALDITLDYFYHQSRAFQPKVRCFIDYFLEKFKQNYSQ